MFLSDTHSFTCCTRVCKQAGTAADCRCGMSVLSFLLSISFLGHALQLQTYFPLPFKLFNNVFISQFTGGNPKTVSCWQEVENVSQGGKTVPIVSLILKSLLVVYLYPSLLAWWSCTCYRLLTAYISCARAVRCCRFITYLCIFEHMWRWPVFGRVDLVFSRWFKYLLLLRFLPEPPPVPFLSFIMSLAIHHFFSLAFLLLIYLDCCLSTPSFTPGTFIFEVYLFPVFHPCKHRSHISFFWPCVLSIYQVFLSLFIASGFIKRLVLDIYYFSFKSLQSVFE